MLAKSNNVCHHKKFTNKINENNNFNVTKCNNLLSLLKRNWNRNLILFQSQCCSPKKEIHYLFSERKKQSRLSSLVDSRLAVQDLVSSEERVLHTTRKKPSETFELDFKT